MKDQPVIEFENISKRFVYNTASPRTVLETLVAAVSSLRAGREASDLWAVRALDLQIWPGQCWGIIGRNGSGKSTVLKLITRILRPTTGRMVVRGRVSALLELGAGFHPDLTGRENVYLNASVLGLNRREVDAAFDSIVAFSELGKFIDMPVKHYSSGMYMRLGFSVAIHVRPDILIVDEVLAVGDQAFQNKCIDHIYKMKRQGVTIIIVSHHASTIRNLCTHALWLDRGEVQAVGAMQDVLPRYEYQQEARRAAEAEAAQQAGAQAAGQGVAITAVRTLTPAGDEAHTFATGDTMDVEIAYTAHTPVRDPIFEIILVRADGVQVNTLAHRLAEAAPLPAGAAGVVRCRLADLPLLPAAYVLKTAVYGPDETSETYAVVERPFQIGSGQPAAGGLVDIHAEWRDISFVER
ncbi:MAG: ABC transporter ATP-binding protein [Anaerolineales bacterium]|nr:ABC transporter ATP-binding protein [Anaerolineales bacterium]